MLARALEFDWSRLSEEIGLWIPVEIHNAEHFDKPEGEPDFGNNLQFHVFLQTSLTCPDLECKYLNILFS